MRTNSPSKAHRKSRLTVLNGCVNLASKQHEESQAQQGPARRASGPISDNTIRLIGINGGATTMNAQQLAADGTDLGEVSLISAPGCEPETCDIRTGVNPCPQRRISDQPEISQGVGELTPVMTSELSTGEGTQKLLSTPSLMQGSLPFFKPRELGLSTLPAPIHDTASLSMHQTRHAQSSQHSRTGQGWEQLPAIRSQGRLSTNIFHVR